MYLKGTSHSKAEVILRSTATELIRSLQRYIIYAKPYSQLYILNDLLLNHKPTLSILVYRLEQYQRCLNSQKELLGKLGGHLFLYLTPSVTLPSTHSTFPYLSRHLPHPRLCVQPQAYLYGVVMSSIQSLGPL